MSDLFERKKRIRSLKLLIKPLRLTPFNWHTQYLDEAVKCFKEKMPISCIVVSSALVETCLCWEHFRQKPKVPVEPNAFRGDTLTSLFNHFLKTDIPLELLLDSDEKLEPLKTMENKERNKRISNFRFVKTRNKFAHGDLFYVTVTNASLLPKDQDELNDYGIEEWEIIGDKGLLAVAYVHLSKTLRFMQAFTNYVITKEEAKKRFGKNNLFGVGLT